MNEGVTATAALRSHTRPRLFFCSWGSFKLLSSGFADYSWPDSPGTWTGMDGVEYDVIISVQADEVGFILDRLTVIMLSATRGEDALLLDDKP